MSNLFWKMILATLCLSLLCMIGVSATENAPREIYVRTGSSGSGTALSPVGTLRFDTAIDTIVPVAVSLFYAIKALSHRHP